MASQSKSGRAEHWRQAIEDWRQSGQRVAAFCRAAVIYSLIASCKRHRIDPFAYLRDVISRVATHPVSQIAELLPACWNPQAAADPRD